MGGTGVFGIPTMSDMTVSNLNVDLIQDQAMISLFKQGAMIPGKASHTALTINVPISAPGNQPENNLRQTAIDEARKVLREALEVLDAYAA